MALALDANEAGRPALEGLADPSGIPRGIPIVWLNQILLLVTSNPVVIVAIKGVVLLGLCWGAILRLAHCLHLPAGPGAALWLCSPFIWFYLRMPWDNIWLLPLSLWFTVLRGALSARRADAARRGRGSVVRADVLPAAGFGGGSARIRGGGRVLPAGAVPTGVPEILCRRRGSSGAARTLAVSGRAGRDVRCRGGPGSVFFRAGGIARCWQNLTAFGFTDRFTPEIGLGIPGLLVMFSIR